MSMAKAYTEKAQEVQGLIISSAHQSSLNNIFVEPQTEEYVRVKVKSCGLCTWEQRVYRGVKPTYPFWGGHEVCGTIDEITGTNPNGFKRGEFVALALMYRCGQCFHCKMGLNNHCAYLNPENNQTFPSGPRGLSNFIFVPPYQVFRLNPEVTPEEGAFVEPIACVIRSIDKGDITFGSTVVVIGSGTMGLLHTALLNMMNCKVIVCDDNLELLNRALKAGADRILPLEAERVEREVQQFTRNLGVDAVFCTRGGNYAVDLALRIVGRGGRVILFQSIRDTNISHFNANDVHYREVQIKGTISQTISDFQRAADLVSRKALSLEFLNIENIEAKFENKAFDKSINPLINRVLVSFN